MFVAVLLYTPKMCSTNPLQSFVYCFKKKRGEGSEISLVFSVLLEKTMGVGTLFSLVFFGFFFFFLKNC